MRSVVRLSSGEVKPTQPPYAGDPCASLEIEVLDEEPIRSVALATAPTAADIARSTDTGAWHAELLARCI